MAKLSREQVEMIRATPATAVDELAELAESYNVHLRTIQQIRALRSWGGVRGRLLPDEVKKCTRCHKNVHRRGANGRRLTDAQWERKRACSLSCDVKLRWRDGLYKNRNK